MKKSSDKSEIMINKCRGGRRRNLRRGEDFRLFKARDVFEGQLQQRLHVCSIYAA